MAVKNIIQVSEYEKLYYDENKSFKQKHWEALCRYIDKQKLQQEKGMDYFRILNKGVQFTYYVGVIQAGDLTIEIIPKIDKGTTVAVNESRQQWQGALLQMLHECSLLKINEAAIARLNLRYQSILTIYLKLFLTATETLLCTGLSKNYEQLEGNQATLKGRLLFQKQVTGNSMHAERFYVRHTAYQYNHMYNRIVCQTLQFIIIINVDINLSDRAGRLLSQFPQTEAITVTAETFNRLQFDRKTERYRDALAIAKLLLLNYRPDITGGKENVIAILFDMNKLWEEWVYRRLKSAEAGFGVTVHRQQSAAFWKADGSPGHNTIRPDIVIQKGDDIIIVDTKWKLIKSGLPDDDDLKQMFIYNLYWKCNKSVLLYPANQLNITTGSYKDFSESKDTHSSCSILTATIFDSKKLDPDFAIKVLEKIL